jgi:hypothetical protein
VLFDRKATFAALYLPEQVYTNDTQILVRQELFCATVTLLSENSGEGYKKYRNLRPFGMLANSLDFDRDDDFLPMMIKYIYDKAAAGGAPADTLCGRWTHTKPWGTIRGGKNEGKHGAA